MKAKREAIQDLASQAEQEIDVIRKEHGDSIVGDHMAFMILMDLHTAVRKIIQSSPRLDGETTITAKLIQL